MGQKQNIILLIFLIIIFFIFTLNNVEDKKMSNNISKNQLKIMYKKGTIVTCPSNNKPVYEISKDIYPYDVVRASFFKGIEGNNNPIAGEIVGESSNCKNNPFKTSSNRVLCIHTSEGWMRYNKLCEL